MIDMTDAQVEQQLREELIASPLERITRSILRDASPRGGALTIREWLRFKSRMTIDRAIDEVRRA